jgi:hypothetical protein
MEEDQETGYVRHQPQKLAQVLLRWYSHTHGFDLKDSLQNSQEKF